MAAYRMIDGLVFKLFDVFGTSLPSDLMIESVLKDRLTDESKQRLCKVSNKYCLIFEIECWNEMPTDIPENNLARQRLEIDRNSMSLKISMSAITGHSFEQLVVYQYLMSWYQGVAGNSSGGNPQSIRKGKRPVDVNRSGVMERDPLSLIYPDFREADDYIRGFYESVAYFYNAGNVEMINLSNSQDIITKERSKLEEKIRSKGFKIADFFCKYCQKYHKFETFKVRENCGSGECKNKSDNSRKLIDRKGWVHSPEVRPKCCAMGGSRRVKLNNCRLCLICHLEIADCIKTFLV